jgi:DNA-binding transcriptional MerR regulator
MSQLTIGQLADMSGVSRATLRYYEEQGLIAPAGRTPAGYRLYDESAPKRLLFIQRAQRLGFALADIRALLPAESDPGDPENIDSLQAIAERRYIQIERELTELLVQRHEMVAFLNDVETRDANADEVYERLVDRVCMHGADAGTAAFATLERLLARTGCALKHDAHDELVAPLAGKHMHIWRDGDSYRILIPDADDAVADALAGVAALEAECHAHAAPQLERTDEGCLFTATGDNAFLFAQLFLDLEATHEHN